GGYARKQVAKALKVTIKPNPAWIGGVMGRTSIAGNIGNALLGLREDNELRDMLAYDEMLCAPMLMKPLRGEPGFRPRPLTDVDVSGIQEILQWAGLYNLGKDAAHQAVLRRAKECPYHPVRDYLNALEWDGTGRLRVWLSAYLGADQNEYTEGIGT